MINGTLEEFFEKLLLGEEIWLLWQGRSFLLQGWYDAEEEKQVLNLDDVTPDDAETESPLWRHLAPTMKENAAVFLATPLFGGRTFLEAESDIEWPDGDAYFGKPEEMSCEDWLAGRREPRRVFRYTAKEKVALAAAAIGSERFR